MGIVWGKEMREYWEVEVVKDSGKEGLWEGKGLEKSNESNNKQKCFVIRVMWRVSRGE